MASDPLKELMDMLEGSQTGLEESLPRVVTGPRQILDEGNKRGWFGYFRQIKITCHNVAVELWAFLSDWFGNWLRVVLTGTVSGAIIGLVYRWILLPN
jgi:hypothetical protein